MYYAVIRLVVIVVVFKWCYCEVDGGSGKRGSYAKGKQEGIQFRSGIELDLPYTVENTGNFEIRLEHFHKALHSALEAEVGYSDEVLVNSIEHERKLLQYRREKGVDDDITLSLPAMACGPTGRRHAEALRDAVGVYKGGRRYTTVQTLYNDVESGSCYLFTGTEDDMINAEAAGFSVVPLPQPAKFNPGLSFTTNIHRSSLEGEEEGAKFELRASLSDDLLHLVGTGVVNGIDLHFSPTLLPRSREDEEKLLHKWFTRIANGGELLSDHWGKSISPSLAAALSKCPTPLHSVAHHGEAFRALDNAHDEVGVYECKWEEWQWEVLSRGGVARLEAKGLSDGVCLSALLAFLASQPEVIYLEQTALPVQLNQEAAWISQSGIPEYTTAWDAGLNGRGEVIGVSDTGVDRYHCHFAEVDGGYPVETSTSENPTADFSKRKIVQYIAYADGTDAQYGHGTHVAGTAAGSTPSLDSGDPGMAYGAQIAVFDFGDSSTEQNRFVDLRDYYTAMLSPLYNTGAVRVQVNSWGSLRVDYTHMDREFDSFVYNFPDMLVVTAAGNCNNVQVTNFDCGPITGEDGSSTVLAPAHAKNVIGVGATVIAEDGNELDEDSYSTVAFFSSQGPTPDGRIKPDVVAPGYPITSAAAGPAGHTYPVCDFSNKAGTSMAAPIVAGNAAIIRQYFSEGWYYSGGSEPNATVGFSPSAALVKAVLINSAKGVKSVETTTSAFGSGSRRQRSKRLRHVLESLMIPPSQPSLSYHHRKMPVTMLDSPPNGAQGFGRITIDQGININGTVGLFFRDEAVSEGGTMVYEVKILPTGDNSKDLSVTLVWTDPVSSPAAVKPVVHDLDLYVVDNSTGVGYYPNRLNGADHTNNVEKVVINPTTYDTTYKIYVQGTVVSETEQQRFAVVANGEFIVTNTPPDPISGGPGPNHGIVQFGAFVDSAWEIVLLVGVILLICGILVAIFFSCCYHKPQRHGGNQRQGTRSQGVTNGPNSIMVKTSSPSTTSASPQRIAEAHVIRVYPTAPSAPPSAPSASRLPFLDEDVCPECGQVFGNDPSALVLHVQNVHRGIARRPPPVLTTPPH